MLKCADSSVLILWQARLATEWHRKKLFLSILAALCYDVIPAILADLQTPSASLTANHLVQARMFSKEQDLPLAETSNFLKKTLDRGIRDS
jgi:hypothetical protein